MCSQKRIEALTNSRAIDSKTLLVSDPHLPTEFHVGHPVPDRTDLEETISQIRSWYSSCVESHDNCRSDSAPYVPTRLLDIGSPLCESGVRLLEAQIDVSNTHVDYVCLSHCWGKSQPDCITLKSTLMSNRKGIRWDAIPKTFQHAIEVLRRLPFRYLWIDSICIVQDDTDDWTREAAAMCSVYSRAALTLAATNSPDSHYGLHSALSENYRSHEFSMALNDGTTTLPVWCRRPIPHFANSETHAIRVNEDAPLLQRGWVLQERLLSRRVVHFANNEVAWECLHRCECQCLGGSGGERFANPKVVLGAFLHGPRTQYMTNHPASQWLEIVEEYTSLALTFTKDRFPALSGASQRSRQYRDGDRYFAGLWESEIHQGLTWCARGPLGERPKAWIAPTWSWGSVDSGVWWPGKHLEIVKAFLTSIDVNCVLAGSDPTGRLLSASMAICGPAAAGILLWENVDAKLDHMFSVQFGSRKMTGCLWPDYALRASGDEHLVPHGSEVLWLAVLDVLWPGGRQHEYAGLILRQSNRRPQEFERIGRLRVENTEDHDFMMERAMERKLIIV